MYQLIIRPRAIKMIQEAHDWYEKQQPGLGDRFLSELYQCYDKIESIPEAYAKIKSNFRQAIFPVFPYVVVFEIHKNIVVVFSVIHTSWNPAKKFKKK